MLNANQDDVVAGILNDMYKKEIFTDKFFDDVIDEDPSKTTVDPRTRMTLRQQQVSVDAWKLTLI